MTRDKTAVMLRADLNDAGIAYRDESGRVAGSHALRHTFITNLARGGVHPKLAQALARHSTITLTMDRYSHTVIGEQADALTALPDLSPTPSHERQRATGTYDSDRQHIRQKLGRQTVRTGATCDDDPTPSAASCHIKGTAPFAENGDELRNGATPGVIGPHRARTCDPLIKSQLPNSINPVKSPSYDAAASDPDTPHDRYAEKPAADAISTNPANRTDDGSLPTPNDAGPTNSTDPELAAVVEAWTTLPDAIRAGIVAMVRASGGMPGA